MIKNIEIHVKFMSCEIYVPQKFVCIWYFCDQIDPHNLAIRCKLNGEIVQDSNTNQLVHKTEALIAFISR